MSLRAHSKNVAFLKVRLDFLLLDGNPRGAGPFPNSKSLIAIAMWSEPQTSVSAGLNVVVEHPCRAFRETVSRWNWVDTLLLRGLDGTQRYSFWKGIRNLGSDAGPQRCPRHSL